MCAPDPDSCITPAFSWTWNPNGCRVGAEAGVMGSEAAPPAAAEDASSAAAASDAASATTWIDATPVEAGSE
jgi:hypothetical protein